MAALSTGGDLSTVQMLCSHPKPLTLFRHYTEPESDGTRARHNQKYQELYIDLGRFVEPSEITTLDEMTGQTEYKPVGNVRAPQKQKPLFTHKQWQKRSRSRARSGSNTINSKTICISLWHKFCAPPKTRAHAPASA